MIVKDDIKILVILCTLINVIISEWPINEKIGDKNNGQPSFVCKIPTGKLWDLETSKAKEKKSMASVLKGVSNGKKYNLIDNPIMTKIDKKIILLFAL